MFVCFQVNTFTIFWYDTFAFHSAHLYPLISFGYADAPKYNMLVCKIKKMLDKILLDAKRLHIYIRLLTDTHHIHVRKAVWFALKTDERNNGTKKQTLCSKCLISSHELVNLKEYDLQMCFSKSKLPGFCGGELISPSMTLDRKGLLLLL